MFCHQFCRLRVAGRGRQASFLSTLPDSMRAVLLPEFGGADKLVLAHDVPLPTLLPDDVMIKVEAAGINRPDIVQREGKYPAPKGHSQILGLEVAGEIVQVGPSGGSQGLAVGDKVCALVNGGGYAEYCAVDKGQVLPVPGGMSMTEAACLPECLFTVWVNVFSRVGLSHKETLLVHGGTSGIGTTAIQLAKLSGARVIATAGSADKCAACVELGADLAVNYKDEDFVEATRAFTNGKVGVL
jgi:NADPH2:quinone reductase